MYFIVYKIGVENVKFSGCVPVEIAYEKQNYTSLNIVVFFLLNNYFEKVEKQISFFFLSAVKNWISKSTYSASCIRLLDLSIDSVMCVTSMWHDINYSYSVG